MRAGHDWYAHRSGGENDGRLGVHTVACIKDTLVPRGELDIHQLERPLMFFATRGGRPMKLRRWTVWRRSTANDAGKPAKHGSQPGILCVARLAAFGGHGAPRRDRTHSEGGDLRATPVIFGGSDLGSR